MRRIWVMLGVMSAVVVVTNGSAGASTRVNAASHGPAAVAAMENV